jgi:serine/threonine-protein kinase mTOR
MLELLLSQHLGIQATLKASPRVVYAQLKYHWASGAQEDSLRFLKSFTESLSQDLRPEFEEVHTHSGRQRYQDLSKLLARCWFKQGQWQVEMHNGWSQVRHAYQ